MEGLDICRTAPPCSQCPSTSCEEILRDNDINAQNLLHAPVGEREADVLLVLVVAVCGEGEAGEGGGGKGHLSRGHHAATHPWLVVTMILEQ